MMQGLAQFRSRSMNDCAGAPRPGITSDRLYADTALGPRHQNQHQHQNQLNPPGMVNCVPPLAHLLPPQIPLRSGPGSHPHSQSVSHLRTRSGPHTSLSMNMNTSFKCPPSIPQVQYVRDMTSKQPVQPVPMYQFAANPHHHAHPHKTATGSVHVSVPIGTPTIVGDGRTNRGYSGRSIVRSQSGNSLLPSSAQSAAHRPHHQYSSNSLALGSLHTVPSLSAVQTQRPPASLMGMHSHIGQQRSTVMFDDQRYQRMHNQLVTGTLTDPSLQQRDIRVQPLPLKSDFQRNSLIPPPSVPNLGCINTANPMKPSEGRPNPSHLPPATSHPHPPLHFQIQHAMSAQPNLQRLSSVPEKANRTLERASSCRSGTTSSLKAVRVPVPQLVSRFRSISSHGLGAMSGSSVRSGGRRVTASNSSGNSIAGRSLDGHSVPVPLSNTSASNSVSFPSGDSTVDRYIGIKRIGAGTFADIWEVYDRFDPSRKHWALKVLKAGKYRTPASGVGPGVGAVDHCKVAKYESAMISEGNRIRKLNDKDRKGSIPIVRCKEMLLSCGGSIGGRSQRTVPFPVAGSGLGPAPLQKPCIVLELMGISLLQYIQICSSKNLVIGLRTVRAIAVQLFSAMSFLHGKGGYIHADLKPENVLITLEDSINGNLWTNIHPKIKVVDLGNALSYYRNINTFEVQSLYYRAPEVLFGNEISAAIDMWSIGCILVELININEFNRKTVKAPNRQKCRSRSSTIHSTSVSHQNHIEMVNQHRDHRPTLTDTLNGIGSAHSSSSRSRTARQSGSGTAIQSGSDRQLIQCHRTIGRNNKSNAERMNDEKRSIQKLTEYRTNLDRESECKVNRELNRQQNANDASAQTEDEMVSLPVPEWQQESDRVERERVNVRQRRPMRRAHHALLACRSTVGLAQKIHSVLSKFPSFVYNPFYSFNFDQMAAAFVPPRVMTDLNTSYQAMKASRKRKLYDRLSIEINETTTEYQQFIDLIAGLLDLDPSTRFTSEDAIQHQFCIGTRWLDSPIVDLLASVYDSAYPIISISDDDDRQMRVNLQIQQYQMITHRVNNSLHPPPPKPKERAITTKNSAFNTPFSGTPTNSTSNGIVHNRAICVINGCCRSTNEHRVHNLEEERLSDREGHQSTIVGKPPPVKKMKLIL